MTYRRQVIEECQVGFPIRKSMDQRVLSPPHGLSQSATSFIASYRQGIHQTPFSRLIRASERMTFCCAAHSKTGQSRNQHHASASARREATCESSRMTPLAAKPIHTFTSLIISHRSRLGREGSIGQCTRATFHVLPHCCFRTCRATRS